jgi:hypothetical protein
MQTLVSERVPAFLPHRAEFRPFFKLTRVMHGLEPLYLQFLSHFASSTMPRMVMYVGSDTFRRGS